MKTPRHLVPALALPTTARYAQFVQIDMRDPPWPYLSDLVTTVREDGRPDSFFAAATTQPLRRDIHGFLSPDGLDGVLPDWYQRVPSWVFGGFGTPTERAIRDYLASRTRHLEVSRGRASDSRRAAAGAVAAIPA